MKEQTSEEIDDFISATNTKENWMPLPSFFTFPLPAIEAKAPKNNADADKRPGETDEGPQLLAQSNMENQKRFFFFLVTFL